MPHGLTRGNFEVGRIEIVGWAGFSASQFGEENVALLGRVLNATQAGWWLSSNRLGFVSAPKLAKAQSKNQTKHGEWGVEKSSESAIFGYPSRSAQVAKNRGRWNAIWEQLGKQGGIRLRVEWVMVLARWPMLGGVS